MYESTIHSKYKGKFEVSLYGENATNPSESLSTYEQAYFTFDFDRNNLIADGSTDIYTIKVPNGCKLIGGYTKISSGGNINILKSTITYANSIYSSEEDNTNTIVMRCPVNQLVSNKDIIASVEVKETIGDKTFTYMDGTFKQTLLEYYENHPLPIQRVEWKQTANEQYLMLPIKDTIEDWSTYLPVNKAPLTDWNFLISGSYAWFRDNNGNQQRIRTAYDVFNTVWLQNIVASSTNAYRDEIISYVRNAYPDLASIQNANIKLPGLKTTRYKTADGDMWKYEIQENFVGYARTAAVDFTKYNYMYFSTSNSDTLDKVFLEYLEKYPYQGVDKEELRNLVDTNGVSNILKLVDANGDIYINGKRLFHYDASDNRLELVKSNIIRVPFSDENTMKTTFESELSKIYEDVSANVIMNSEDVINSLLKNSTSNSKKESYNEYFIVQDGNKYLLVNVYSTGKDCTYVTISTLDAKLENDTLSFNISDKNQENLLSIVNALDEHFIGRKIHSNLPSYDSYLIVTTSDDITNVVYTVPNKQAYATFDRQTTTEKEMTDNFIENLWNAYKGSGIVSKETIDYVLNSDTINKLDTRISPGYYMLRPILKKSSGEFVFNPVAPYNFYFVVPGQGDIDAGKYLLFNVYTSGYDRVYTSISVLASKEENGIVYFELQNDNLSKLRQIVRGLDFYFTGKYLHDTITDTTISVSYPITSTASIQDSNKIEEIKEVSASLKASQTNKEYLEVVSEVNDTIDIKSNSIIDEEEEENKKYSNTQDTETNKTTEETEETSNDGSYVPSSDASNVDAGPSSDGGTNLTSSIANEVVEVNSSPTNGVPLVEAG